MPPRPGDPLRPTHLHQETSVTDVDEAQPGLQIRSFSFCPPFSDLPALKMREWRGKPSYSCLSDPS